MLDKVNQGSAVVAGEEMEDGPALKGITVVDMTQFEAGTFCTQQLAWLGADVIKVEPPQGEQGRGASGGAYYFMILNSNKKCVTLNLKTEKGKEMLRDLIRRADVFIENFGPGAIERLGFGYDEVRKLNPRCIYTQIKGFAQDGPFKNYLAFDMIAQATGGSMAVTGWPDRGPVRPGINVGDTGTALHATIGVLAALQQRERTGKGQRVQVAMQECVANFGRVAFSAQATFGRPPSRMGNLSLFSPTAPSDAFPCKGGGPNDYCYILCQRDGNRHWDALLKVMGREDLMTDARFNTPDARSQNRKEVDAVITEWTTKHDKMTVMKLVAEAGVPTGAVMDTAELAADPALLKRKSMVRMEGEGIKPFVMPGNPIKMSASHVDIKLAEPLGGSNQRVFGDVLGMSAAEVQKLREDKIT